MSSIFPIIPISQNKLSDVKRYSYNRCYYRGSKLKIMRKPIIKSILLITLSSILSLTIYSTFILDRDQNIQATYAYPKLVNHVKPVNPAHMQGWSTTAPLNFTSAASLATSAVVSINAHDGNDMSFFGRERFENSMGSGVIVHRDGYLVTNRHVIENMNYIEVSLHNKSVYPASLVGIDASTDLAVLKIDGAEFSYLDFADSDQTNIGEWVLAVGNPFSLSSTVTAGIVSAKGRSIDILDDPSSVESFIQTDAAVNAGNSGGALVNTQGKLVGINTAILTKSGRYEGYSFAVPSNLVKKVCEDLIEYGAVQRAYLGVGIEELTLGKAAKLGLDHAFGTLINRIEPNSAADDAGLQVGDVVVELDGFLTNEVSILQERVALKRPGEKVQLKVRRRDKIVLMDVALKNINNERAIIRAPRNKLMTEIGFSIRDLNNFEKELHELEGVKITLVDQSGKAAKVGIKKDFIIEFCNDVKIISTNQLMELLEEVRGDIYLEGHYPDDNTTNSHTYILKR